MRPWVEMRGAGEEGGEADRALRVGLGAEGLCAELDLSADAAVKVGIEEERASGGLLVAVVGAEAREGAADRDVGAGRDAGVASLCAGGDGGGEDKAEGEQAAWGH